MKLGTQTCPRLRDLSSLCISPLASCMEYLLLRLNMQDHYKVSYSHMGALTCKTIQKLPSILTLGNQSPPTEGCFQLSHGKTGSLVFSYYGFAPLSPLINGEYSITAMPFEATINLWHDLICICVI